MFARIVFGEIRHRWLSFLTGLISVATAVGCLVGALNLLESHDIRTERIIARKEAELDRRIEALQDDYRKITKRMGFNVLILPKAQDLGELWARDYASAYMPEEYATRLAESKIMSVQHLLPALQEKLFWPEKRREIILVGVRGEVPLVHRNIARKPLLKPVRPGTMVVGHALHAELGLSKGGTAALLGERFTVGECLPQRGSKDDITVWIDLERAQRMLNKPGLINGIWALECRCAWADLAKVREEITKVLPDTQVIEMAGRALARAEARRRAEEEGKALIAAEKESRERLRREKEQFAAVLAPVVIVAAAVWIAFLAFGNVRARRPEIGILRAIGVRSSRILAIFLARAAMLGALGGLIGYFAGVAAVSRWSAAGWWDARMLGVAVLSAPLLAGVASWLPALSAAGQDPARVLREG